MVCPLPICAKVVERRRAPERRGDPVDYRNADLFIVGPGTGPHSTRVMCRGCGGFVRWAPKERTPEELAARDAMRSKCRREYYEARGWDIKREDLPADDWLATYDEYPPASGAVGDAAARHYAAELAIIERRIDAEWRAALAADAASSPRLNDADVDAILVDVLG